MTTKKTPVVKEQGFKKFYIATHWEIGDKLNNFCKYVTHAGQTVEEAVKLYVQDEEGAPKYIYVVTEQLKAVTTYK